MSYGTYAYSLNHPLFKTFLQYTKKFDFGIMLGDKGQEKSAIIARSRIDSLSINIHDMFRNMDRIDSTGLVNV